MPAGSGPDYVNAAAMVRTVLSPEALLAVLHEIEAEFGRERTAGERWRSRPLDLDLLAVEQIVMPDVATQSEWRSLPFERQTVDIPDTLILPHPRLQDRGFVLAPLAQIAPSWTHPVTGLTTAQMLAALPADQLAGMRQMPLTIV